MGKPHLLVCVADETGLAVVGTFSIEAYQAGNADIELLARCSWQPDSSALALADGSGTVHLITRRAA